MFAVQATVYLYEKFVYFQAYNGHVDALGAIVSFTINLDLQDARGKSTTANIAINFNFPDSFFLS